MDEFLKLFRGISQRFHPYSLWSDFITMYACAISNTVDKAHYNERESLYLKMIRKYNAEERMVFPKLAAEVVVALEKNPEQDFLGSAYMALNLGNQKAGQFFTPYDICKMMASVTVGDVSDHIKKDGYVSVCDPACGAGATLIAAIHEIGRALEKDKLNWQNHVLAVGQDIDTTTALMCYIQLSLLGCAGYIKIGNTLTDPMSENDSKENYWYTPMYFMEPWPTYRMLDKSQKLLNKIGG